MRSQRGLTWKQAWQEGDGPETPKEIVFLTLKGFAMGMADLIPGVSGGTIAFITGIYENLLEAVASIDRKAFGNLFTFYWKDMLAGIHTRFIAPLAFGLFLALLLLARLMHFLITEHPIPTWSLFFGLILASVVVIWRHLEEPLAAGNMLAMILGAIGAYFFVGMIPVTTPQDWWFIFLCGMIGISAMILPGLSGSFLLLILGKYEYITGALKNPFDGGNFVILAIFACGTAVGLLGFSKILNWLMKHYHGLTMAVLTGILMGSLRKVWPWKEVLETKVIRGKERVLQEANRLPEAFGGEEFLALSLMLLGLAAVLFMEWRRHGVSNKAA